MQKDKLETPRLSIVPISINHISSNYINWLNDEVVYKYLETRGGYSIEMLNQYIKDMIDKNVYMWGIHLKNSNKHIGNIKIDPINQKHGFGEYGILIGDKEAWGKGYAKEASMAIIDYFFNKHLFLRKITLGVIAENKNAVELYQKIGFIVEGIYRKHVNYDGEYYDIIRMAIFNPRYKYDK